MGGRRENIVMQSDSENGTFRTMKQRSILILLYFSSDSVWRFANRFGEYRCLCPVAFLYPFITLCQRFLTGGFLGQDIFPAIPITDLHDRLRRIGGISARFLSPDSTLSVGAKSNYNLIQRLHLSRARHPQNRGAALGKYIKTS